MSPQLRGIDDAPVELVPAGAAAGIVSRVAAEEYGETALDARLADLDWVGERGRQHERVLTWFVDHATVVPLRPFSLHADEQRLRKRLESGAADYLRVLERLAGRKQWALRVWRAAGVAGGLAGLSPRLAELEREIAAATPGRRYLLERKRDGVRDEELRRASAELAERTFADLTGHADAAKRLPIAAPGEPAARAMVLNAAFLVRDDTFDAFQARLTELAEPYRRAGFEWEFTGPWPAYDFAEP